MRFNIIALFSPMNQKILRLTHGDSHLKNSQASFVIRRLKATSWRSPNVGKRGNKSQVSHYDFWEFTGKILRPPMNRMDIIRLFHLNFVFDLEVLSLLFFGLVIHPPFSRWLSSGNSVGFPSLNLTCKGDMQWSRRWRWPDGKITAIYGKINLGWLTITCQT